MLLPPNCGPIWECWSNEPPTKPLQSQTHPLTKIKLKVSIKAKHRAEVILTHHQNMVNKFKPSKYMLCLVVIAREQPEARTSQEKRKMSTKLTENQRLIKKRKKRGEVGSCREQR